MTTMHEWKKPEVIGPTTKFGKIITVNGQRYRVIVHSTTCEVFSWCDTGESWRMSHWRLMDVPPLRSVAAVERWLRVHDAPG